MPKFPSAHVPASDLIARAFFWDSWALRHMGTWAPYLGT